MRSESAALACNLCVLLAIRLAALVEGNSRFSPPVVHYASRPGFAIVPEPTQAERLSTPSACKADLPRAITHIARLHTQGHKPRDLRYAPRVLS